MAATLRVGVVGTGEIARNEHLPAYAQHPEVDIVAIAELDPEARRATQRKFAVDASYGDGLEMIEREDLDVLSICTPVTAHEEFFLPAADRGIAIYCEKPFAPTLESAKTMRNAADRNGVITQVGYKYRLFENFDRVRRLAQNHVLGRIKSMSVVFQSFPSKKGWYQQKEFPGGGVVKEIFSHHTDFCLELFGELPSVERAEVDSILTNHVEDYAEIALDFDGVTVTAILGQTQESYAVHRNHLVGTEGVAEFNMKRLSTHLRNNHEYKWGNPPMVDLSFFQHWMGAADDIGTRRITNFIDHVLAGDRDTAAPVERGVEVTAIADEIYETAGVK
jgi:predicted dehydrogenase